MVSPPPPAFAAGVSVSGGASAADCACGGSETTWAPTCTSLSTSMAPTAGLEAEPSRRCPLEAWGASVVTLALQPGGYLQGSIHWASLAPSCCCQVPLQVSGVSDHWNIVFRLPFLGGDLEASVQVFPTVLMVDLVRPHALWAWLLGAV